MGTQTSELQERRIEVTRPRGLADDDNGVAEPNASRGAQRRDAGFALGNFFPAPASAQEGELCRSYLKQLREEMGRRVVAKVYADGPPSKFWLVFAKRKFMNKSLV